MKTSINISGQPVELNSSAGWLFVYREQFGHDILPDLLPLLEAALDAIINSLQGVEDTTELDTGKLLQSLDEDTIQRILISLSGLEVTTLLNIVWSLAKNADDDIDAPRKWINSFDNFPLDVITPQVFTLIVESSISSKKAKALLAKTKKKKSTSTDSSSPDSTGA